MMFAKAGASLQKQSLVAYFMPLVFRPLLMRPPEIRRSMMAERKSNVVETPSVLFLQMDPTRRQKQLGELQYLQDFRL